MGWMNSALIFERATETLHDTQEFRLGLTFYGQLSGKDSAAKPESSPA
jgi:hypothetical protein